MSGFQNKRWHDSLHSLVNGLESFLQSLQGLNKGVVNYCCLRNISVFQGDGTWSPKHNSKRSKPLLVRSTSGPEKGKGEGVDPIFVSF